MQRVVRENVRGVSRAQGAQMSIEGHDHDCECRRCITDEVMERMGTDKPMMSDELTALEMIASIVKAPIDDVIGGVRNIVHERDEALSKVKQLQEDNGKYVDGFCDMRDERDRARAIAREWEVKCDNRVAALAQRDRRIAELEAELRLIKEDDDACIRASRRRPVDEITRQRIDAALSAPAQPATEESARAVHPEHVNGCIYCGPMRKALAALDAARSKETK
jgi:hypothetical protein